MKKVMWMIVCGWLATGVAVAQTDGARMEQDLEVAENILGTLMQQQMGRRSFMPFEFESNYTPGYGATFRMPQGFFFNRFMFDMMSAPAIAGWKGDGSYSYSISTAPLPDDDCVDCERIKSKNRTVVATPKGSLKKTNADSVATAVEKIFLDVAKNFLADYGDVISQLKPGERILITNRPAEFNGFDLMVPGQMGESRSLISAEASRDDILQLKQGKLSRNQFMERVKVVNTKTVDKLDPDLEVLSSMFNRLYREDLSKTYFVQGGVGYERLKDFGAVYYMRVYSSYEEGDELFRIPGSSRTETLDRKQRDARVKELYPKFEAELKENIVEYGRTLRSLGEDESLVFNVRLTKCVGCGIPESLEISIKNSALRDYNAGKSTREATIAKMNVKKIGAQ